MRYLQNLIESPTNGTVNSTNNKKRYYTLTSVKKRSIWIISVSGISSKLAVVIIAIMNSLFGCCGLWITERCGLPCLLFHIWVHRYTDIAIAMKLIRSKSLWWAELISSINLFVPSYVLNVFSHLSRELKNFFIFIDHR